MNKNSKNKPITYSSSGVNYNNVDPTKKLAQLLGKKTAGSLHKFEMQEVVESRGESAYVWEENDIFRAFVMEGLGTKNGIADEMRKIISKTYYDSIAQDTIAAIINDLIVVGAEPLVVNAYFGVENYDWFLDKKRSLDLINGWAKACKIAGVTWGGGETAALRTIIETGAIDLAGAAIGIIKPKERLTLGNKLKSGDAILLIESSGIHTNGISLAREIASRLPDGYATPLSDGKSYGESLLIPAHIYASLVKDLFEAGIDIHYMVNITGHGWRKLMRANKDFSYVIERVPEPQLVFKFIQEHSGNGDKEMYGNFNMGAGFAILMLEKDIKPATEIAGKHNLRSWNAGYVEKGPRQVIIKPKKIIFRSESLKIR